jgi:hypothetical protein
MIKDSFEKEVIKKYYKFGYFGKIKLKDSLMKAIVQNFTRFKTLIAKKPTFVEKSFDSILKLSRDYNIPPYVLIKDVGLSLTEKQKKLIKKIDQYTYPENCEKTLKKAHKFEKKFEKKLIKNNITGFKTENDLRKENVKLTPDFYFPNGLKINNKVIYWIDVKNYYGGNNNFVKRVITKQGNKYVNYFGAGCFVFKYDYNEVLSVPKCDFFSYREFSGIMKKLRTD